MRSKGTVFERAEPQAEKKLANPSLLWRSAPVELKYSGIDSMALAASTSSDKVNTPGVLCIQPLSTSSRYSRPDGTPQNTPFRAGHAQINDILALLGRPRNHGRL
jgi:hypothetical protein